VRPKAAHLPLNGTAAIVHCSVYSYRHADTARSHLKIRLTLQVIAVSVACFAATSVWTVLDAGRSARSRIDGIAALAAQDLELRPGLQRSKLHWISDPSAAFPDLQTIAPRS